MLFFFHKRRHDEPHIFHDGAVLSFGDRELPIQSISQFWSKDITKEENARFIIPMLAFLFAGFVLFHYHENFSLFFYISMVSLLAALLCFLKGVLGGKKYILSISLTSGQTIFLPFSDKDSLLAAQNVIREALQSNTTTQKISVRDCQLTSIENSTLINSPVSSMHDTHNKGI